MNRKIKVIHVVPDLGTGGAEKLVIDLVSNIDKSKFDIEILSLYPKQNNIYEDIVLDKNIKIKYLNKKKGFDIKIIYKIVEYFKCERPDVIHTHRYVYPYVLFGNIVSGVKVRIHTVHNIADKELQKKLRFIMNIAYKYLGCVPVAISDYIKDTICKSYKLKSEEVTCIYNCIDTKLFNKEYKIKRDKCINYINIGRMSEQKNQQLLIEAFSEVSRVIENSKLTIIGDGELRKDIEEKIYQYNIDDKVELVGIQKDVKKYLNRSDIFVLTSNYEGLPLSVLEAMACGLPIITTKVGGTVDVVRDNKNGILVNVNDKANLVRAMLLLGKNTELREDMSKESLIESSKYDINEMVRKYEELYEKKLYGTKGKN